MRTSPLPLALAPLALLAGCGSSSDADPSSPTTIQGLAGPAAISIVTADDSNISTGAPAGGSAGLSWPAGSDYLTDVARVHVYDPSMQALDQGNQILCMLGMTAYSQMVNEGVYQALVDEALCTTGQEPSDGSGESSSQAQNLGVFTVDATRASNEAPQINRFWVPVNGPDDMPALIHGRMTVAAGPTEDDPFGTFAIDFAGVADGQTVQDAEMIGVLRSGDLALPGYEFFEEQGDVDVPAQPDTYSYRTAVHVSVDPGTGTGAARIRLIERYDDGGGDTGQLSSEFRIAFNETHLKRQLDAGPVTTLSRTDFTDNVFRYNLYHADGAELGERVELASGFTIRAETGEYGWAGFHGIWMPEPVELGDGDVVTRPGEGSQVESEYTVDISPGRLSEFTRDTLSLASLTGQIFEWWELGTQYRVDYSVADFRRIAEWDANIESWLPIDPPTVIDVGAAGGFLNMWSQTLGGPVTYVDSTDHVTYFVERFVGRDHDVLTHAMNGEVQLLGLVQCLRAEITANEAELGDIYLPDAPNPGTPHVYRFNADDLTLRHDPNGDGSVLHVVGLADGEMPVAGPNTWGMRSGPLVESTQGLGSVSEVWNVDAFFVYETGHNSWNRRVALLDALGAPVVFDRPLEFLYTHTTDNDINGDSTYHGQSFVLSYSGPGSLHGVPADGVDLDGDMAADRWYPRFSIKDGTLMGPSGTEFALRAIEVEQTLNEDPGGSPALDVAAADALALPDGSDYVVPDIGEQPVVTDPPAVINGVVQ